MAQGPIVRISREPASQARIKGQRPRFPRAISSDEQSRRHDAKFAGIETSISQVLSGADLSHSPTEVIPERALVFEVIGPLSNVTRFASAAREAGFDWLGEDYVDDSDDDDEEEDADGETDAPEDDTVQDTGQSMLYVPMPRMRGPQKILSLWKQFKTGGSKPRSEDGQWWPLFSYLSDVRPWSPKDRVDPGVAVFVDKMMRKYPDRPVRLELEIGRASCRERVCQYV